LLTSISGEVVIVNTTRIQVRPEKWKEFLQTIRPLLQPIRNEKGCRAYRVFVDVSDENSSLLVGEWQTHEDWSNHLKSDDFAILMGAITVLGSPNCIEFRLLSSVPMPKIL
jgi:quinol monooxygenase YgiN